MRDLLIIGGIIFGVLILITIAGAVLTDQSYYLTGSVDYPDQIEPSEKVDYGSNAKSAGSSSTFTNTATPEPEDQDEGYSEDNENLESA